MNWRKPTLCAIVAGAAIIGGALGASDSVERADDDATAPREVAVATAHAGPLKQTVQATGKVASNLDVEIKCRASGEVVKLPYDISDTVKKGDQLLAIDPRDQQRAVNKAEANLAAVQAQWEQARAALNSAQKQLESDRHEAVAAVFASQARASDAASKAMRERELFAKKYSSPESLETAETVVVEAEQELKTAHAQTRTVEAQELNLETYRQQIRLSAAQLDAAKIALDLAKLQLSYTSIYAPIDGVVSSRTVQVGNIISSGVSNANGGTTVMVLSDLSHIYVLASVDESQIGLISLGQPVEVTVDAFPKTVFGGEVNRIATKGVKVTNVTTFEVRVEVTSDNRTLLRPEMTAAVAVVIANKPSALQVPAFAIINKRDGDFVAVKKSNGAPEEIKAIEAGITDGVATEIVSGLAEGDTVVIQDIESEGRSRSAEDPAHDARRRQRMMMGTMGGGRGMHIH